MLTLKVTQNSLPGSGLTAATENNYGHKLMLYSRLIFRPAFLQLNSSSAWIVRGPATSFTLAPT